MPQEKGDELAAMTAREAALAEALTQIRDTASPGSALSSNARDGTWREFCRDIQRIALVALARRAREL